MLQLIAALLTDQVSAPNIISAPGDTSSHTAEGVAIAGINFKSNGAYSKYLYGAEVDTGYWVSPLTNFSQYEIHVAVASGDTPSGSALNTWLNLGTSRAWFLGVTATDSETCSLTVQIRWTGNNEVQASGTYVLTATAV